ncbi:serine hydrolase domain-containing protein [Nocardioides mangrovi]|uniref:Beta-lactamase family protein n=1 Tax=Nocardioides mangrovi TaxID=2874580 RepID=A0ABS7UE73_9ACTN|nr:serine hydrolase domain-containing protein [Nocardioides mangrovi]MBZ5738942.1 beta-lactamase family protein [Nocardioides mangrovi]
MNDAIPVSDSTARRLQARLAHAQSTGRLPSVTAGLVRDGEPVWLGSYGGPAVPGHDPHDVQYRIGSITKTMTAVVVLQLVRDGRIALDDPASVALGEVGYADRTLRQLLSHGSGMQSEPVGSWWERSAGLSFDELVAANDGSRAVFRPGERFHYSNLGYALLGELVARLLGTTWWEAVRERVLTPLGMARTSYLPDGAAAQGQSVHPYDGTLVAEPATDTGAMAPAGQVWATIEDLARYAVFLGQGHPDVLSADELAQAFAPQAGSPEDGLGGAHGLGFQVMAGGSGTLAGHTGSMPGFLATVLVDIKRRTGGVVLANATTGYSPARIVIELLDELERSEPTIAAPWVPSSGVPAELAGVPGLWHWGNTPVVFAMAGTDLVGSRNGVEAYRFAVRDGRVVGTTGYHAGEELHAVRREDGSVAWLDIATFIYTREPYDPEAPIPGGHPA